MVTYPPLTCLVIVVHESLVFPELFFREILELLHIRWFSSICVFEPFPRSIFPHCGQLRDSYITITKDGNIY